MSVAKTLTLVFCFLLSSSCYSQNAEDDVVYMNSGAYLRGKIIELISGESLKICIANKDTLVVQMNDVKMIRKEICPVVKKVNFENGIKAWGYTFIGELSFGFGLLEGIERYFDSPREQYSITLSVFNGATITPYIQLGLGVALQFWNSRGFLPIYLDLRTNMLKKDNSPFLYLNAGYSLGWMTGESGVGFGGAMTGIGAGAKLRISKKRVMVFSLGYLFQQTRQWQVNFNVKSKATCDSHFVNLKAGFIF